MMLQSQKIPVYDLVVVDEFQDFNRLEVSLIELLAEKSPVLLAGDDDQALYEFKNASPEHIRQMHAGSYGYQAFCLPYCSRCSRVIVETVNDIITSAVKNGYLRDRIDKDFLYYSDKEKDKVSNANPSLIYSQLQASQIPWFLQKNIENIAKEVRDKFKVLIICPTRVQCNTLFKALKDRGFEEIQSVDRSDTREVQLLDGLKHLLKYSDCNLGWRVVCGKLLEKAQFQDLLKSSEKDHSKKFSDLIPKEPKQLMRQMLTILRKVRNEEQKDDEKFADVLEKINLNAYGMAREHLKKEIRLCKPSPKQPIPCRPAVRKIPITITTIESSKGLDADYVFISYFDDKYLVRGKDKSKITDRHICNFLVALTRARKKAFLISSDKARRPLFINWIDKARIEEIRFKDRKAQQSG